jgi:hypothetical protein
MHFCHIFYESDVDTANRTHSMKGTSVFSVTECSLFNQNVLNVYSVSANFKLV